MHAQKGENRAQFWALANVGCLGIDYKFKTQRNIWKEVFCAHLAACLGPFKVLAPVAAGWSK